jgi:hypothetical protein
VKEGEKADFNCKVIGHPTPELTWFFNGEPLEGQGRYTLCQKDDLQVGHNSTAQNCREKHLCFVLVL